MSSRNASRGLRIRGNSAGSAPSCGTFQFFMSMPLGTYRKARRTGDFGAAANAGTIESRNGRATVAPTPFRKVLRGTALPVMIMEPPPRSGHRSYSGTASGGQFPCIRPTLPTAGPDGIGFARPT
jgi:hypothetical protein